MFLLPDTGKLFLNQLPLNNSINLKKFIKKNYPPKKKSSVEKLEKKKKTYFGKSRLVVKGVHQSLEALDF